MTISHRFRGAALVLSALVAGPVLAMDGEGGGLFGWVENTHGMPVAGAMISVFGKGIRGGALVTLSDSSGQFILPSLPAGSYTLRALGSGHLPAPPRRITVLPDRDLLFTVNLTPVGEVPVRAKAEPADDDDQVIDAREARWLMRHKRRSVLEAHADDPAAGGAEPSPDSAALFQRVASWVPDLAGKVEVMASAAAFGVDGEPTGIDRMPAGLGVLRLNGRLAENGRWSLGGLVSESESTSWRMAAEFAVEPGGGHRIQAGGGYGSRYLRSPLESDAADGRLEGTGALFIQDRWRLSSRLTVSVGARYSYIGFLEDSNHLDPVATIEYRNRRTAIRGTVAARTLAPGGDLLTLSTLSSAPVLSFAGIEADLRPERLIRYELGVDRSLGPTSLGAHAFQEDLRDQLVNVFDDPYLARSLRILNAGPLTARGMGVTVSGRLGDLVNGSFTYTYGRSWRDDPASVEAVLGAASALSYREADFHDVVARFETFLDCTDTRVVAFYRVNTLNPDSEGPGGHSALTNTRFDIQLSQGLPFMQSLTRAEWELLLAVRNLFYETTEGAALDEVVVSHPPKRLLGGISVRF